MNVIIEIACSFSHLKDFIHKDNYLSVNIYSLYMYNLQTKHLSVINFVIYMYIQTIFVCRHDKEWNILLYHFSDSWSHLVSHLGFMCNPSTFV